jgi:hypothetical protein
MSPSGPGLDGAFSSSTFQLQRTNIGRHPVLSDRAVLSAADQYMRANRAASVTAA